MQVVKKAFLAVFAIANEELTSAEEQFKFFTLIK